MPEAHHSIQLAARLTGLSTHVIRIWEQRYHAVEPRRTAANHRLYSQDDIERLGLLRDVTHAGHNISQVARLSNDELRALAANAPGLELQVPRAAAATPAYRETLVGLGAILVADLVQLGLALDRLRQSAGKAKR